MTDKNSILFRFIFSVSLVVFALFTQYTVHTVEEWTAHMFRQLSPNMGAILLRLVVTIWIFLLAFLLTLLFNIKSLKTRAASRVRWHRPVLVCAAFVVIYFLTLYHVNVDLSALFGSDYTGAMENYFWIALLLPFLWEYALG